MVAEKDWDKTVGTAADARRIFENVPAEFADLAANIAAGTGGFVLAGPARHVDRICSETIELLLRSTCYTTMSHCLRRNGAHQHRRYTWRWMRRSTPPARFAPGFVNGRWRSAPIPPTSLTSCTQSPSSWRTQVVEASLAGAGNLHASVIDRGQWKDYREGEQGRGRGLAMAEALVHHAHVTHGVRGTTAHRIHLGPSDRCRKPFRHGAFDDRSESGHPPRVGRRQRAGRRPRPGAQAGWRLRAGRPARKPGAPGQERLRRGVDRGQEFWPCRT
jgi:hypothetical protein